MDTLTVGELELPIIVPDRAALDAALIGRTGCSAAEVALMLAGAPLAGFAALALQPFVPDQALPTLITAIAADAAAIGEIRALYAALPAEGPAAAEPAHKDDPE
jgi:hypothetical protein